MKHYGDITKIHGWEVPIVDVITGGSPCQDLSVAGKRAGLDGERSGLFMEQIRIIKEMREYDRRANGRTDDLLRPRYMVWENVCGALSSNKGEDFRVVLEETARVTDKDAVIPGLAKGQKWAYSGCIMGDGWSIAWRVHDAQFWGVPQRRKRIALVADFGGASASEILFERKGVSGNFEKNEKVEQANFFSINSNVRGTGIDGYTGLITGDVIGTLGTGCGSPTNRGGAMVYTGRILRRLTPLECERLQGYPDGWTNIGDWIDSKGKKHKGNADSPRYKALGNSIALPFWQYLADKMCNQLRSDGIEEPTMASLFDGISGFCLVYARAGVTPVWASEIEEFPIAVAKKHFGDDDTELEGDYEQYL